MTSVRHVLALVGVFSCGVSTEHQERLGASAASIVGGAPDAVDTDVFLLDLRLDGTRSGVCSATLISPRVLLTAAHCLDPTSHGATTLTARAMNRPDDTGVTSADFIELTDWRLHPQWVHATPPGPFDVAVAWLARAPGVSARPLSRAAPTVGSPVRVVGYGRTAAGVADSGARRSASTTVTQVSSDQFRLGLAASVGTCLGDSGGPALLRGTDDLERVAGVHSSGGASCGEGVEIRVDRHLAFIDSYVELRDPPQCSADGRCQPTGCTAVDPDCACAADGRCPAGCPDVSLDPDCPVDCRANAVCAAQPCPRPDPDCALDGDACTRPSECLEQQCVPDPRGFSFCSRPCAATSDCIREMSCQQGLCRAPPSSRPPLPGVVGRCSTAAEWPVALGALWLIRRTRGRFGRPGDACST